MENSGLAPEWSAAGAAQRALQREAEQSHETRERIKKGYGVSDAHQQTLQQYDGYQFKKEEPQDGVAAERLIIALRNAGAIWPGCRVEGNARGLMTIMHNEHYVAYIDMQDASLHRVDRGDSRG